MPQPQLEPTLTIAWPGRDDNQVPRGIVSYSIDSQYLVSTDEFEIVVIDDDPARVRWLQLEPVELSIHGEVVMVGRIERVERGGEGRAVTLRGRDYMANLVQGEIDPTVKIEESQSFEDVILYCAGPYGISSVVDFTGKGIAQLKPGERKPEPGQGVYDFLNRIAARLGCTIQPGTSADTLVLDAPQYDLPINGRLTRSSDPIVQRSNNIKSATSSEDYTRIPTHGAATGKVAKQGENAETVSFAYNLQDVLGGISDALLNGLAGKVDGNRRKPSAGAGDPSLLYRLLYVNDKDARTADQIERAITRAVGERLKDTLEYQATVVGHRDQQNGRIWTPNTVLDVVDDVCDVEERLWVAGRRFSYSQQGGAEAQLTMWRLGAFQV